MAKFEIEIGDGEFVGEVPAELTSILDKIKSAAHGEGYGKGAQKAAEEAKGQIDAAIKAEKAKLEAAFPLEKAKWDDIDSTNKHLKGQIETTIAENRKRMTEREEAHAVELTSRMEALNKRNEKIKALVNQNLRGLALTTGAREDCLDTVAIVLRERIGFDDDMEPYVKGEDGKPAKTAAGNPLAIDVFVKQFMDSNAYFRKPVQGQGGGARGGASQHARGSQPNAESARARVEAGDRSPTAITELYNATRKSA